ncbi:hypothetical protein [Goodfellowiella coeruleoviolacea]|uniref:PE domain-containing protein n=1 Tax=Goodfellowiella coeruleoviolacea TaxID=334858 RepID=A0AAE3GLP5_9PSEU|nr:hypothetical protein [Goodfellowiella coeruleoviolacea]MCP2168283.1 hypothetical protein [Goodfellowiella coeruleoviolacea]
MNEWRGADRPFDNAPWNKENQPAPPVQPWSGGGGKVTVNKDNVLQIAKLFQDKAIQLYETVDRRANRMRSKPAWDDPVSKDMARVLNYRLIDASDSYISRARQYADNLADTAEELKATAKSYGYTDEDIKRALDENG